MADQVEKILKVIIQDAEKVVYEGTADSVTSYNDRGTFDVLPYHTQFIAMIKKSITIHKKGQEKKEFTIDVGVIEVLRNEVNVFLGIDVIKV